MERESGVYNCLGMVEYEIGQDQEIECTLRRVLWKLLEQVLDGMPPYVTLIVCK